MVVQCPQCGTAHLVDEADFSGSRVLKVECTKCQAHFTAQAPKTPASPPGKHPAEPEDSSLTTVIANRTKLPNKKKVALLAMKGPLVGATFYIAKPEVLIGRSGVDIVIDDPEVSTKHCSLEVRGESAVLTDLGSTNGTFVGEEAIKSCQLEHLSEFRIGRTVLMYTVTIAE